MDQQEQQQQQDPQESNPLNALDFSAEAIESFLGGVLAPSGFPTVETPAASTISPEDSAEARTERKRSRERQRRLDVNKQFAELTDAMRKIESESEDWKQQPHLSATNRADIIARTVSLLNSLHAANEKRKRQVVTLEKDLEAAQKTSEETAAKLKEQMMSPQPMTGGKMMMMVPMMIGGDGGPTPYGQMPAPMFMPPSGGEGMPQWGQMAPPTWGMAGGWGMAAPVPAAAAAPDEKQKAQPPNTPAAEESQSDTSNNGTNGNLAHCA